MATEYDGVWKEALERFFPLVVAFFFPQLHEEIDWTQGWESLATELRRILPQAAVGTRFCDALVKVNTLGGDVRYVHIEVQCQQEGSFDYRLDVYISLCQLSLSHPVLTFVILGDDSPTWMLPCQYVHHGAGYRKQVDYPARKIVAYRGQQEQLSRDENPLALLVLGHLLTLETTEQAPARQEGKLRLLQTRVCQASR